MTYLHGQHALVTGGTGSVGKATVLALLDAGITSVTIFSRDETKQYEMLCEEKFNNSKINFMLGDVRDCDALAVAMKNKNLVFHCAALKHVPFCEHDVNEAIKTNVLGAMNVVACAEKEESVKTVVACSTDKACNPSTTMGTTKLLQERIFQNAKAIGLFKKFVCVRFGNLLESRGSVFHRFIKQRDEPEISLTHLEMRRFVSTLEQASKTMLFAALNGRHGDIVIHDCPAVKMLDVIKVLSPKAEIKIVGVRQNEKIDEELYSETEAVHVRVGGLNNEFFVISQQSDYTEVLKKIPNSYSSKDHCVDRDGARKILKDFCERCGYEWR